MNKKLSRTAGPSIFLLRVVSHAAVMFAVFSFHAVAQELREAEASVSQPTTTAFASANPATSSRLPVDPVPGSLVDAPSAVFLRMAASVDSNIAMDSDTRNQLTHRDFWAKYEYCVRHYRWSRWKDYDAFGVDYIGHPMTGAVTSSIYEQNDPKQRALMYENSQRYWMGRLRAMAYSAAYSAQWKVGPVSEASVGNTGITTTSVRVMAFTRTRPACRISL